MNTLSSSTSYRNQEIYHIAGSFIDSFTGITNDILDDTMKRQNDWDERGFLLKRDLIPSAKRNKEYRRKGKFR